MDLLSVIKGGDLKKAKALYDVPSGILAIVTTEIIKDVINLQDYYTDDDVMWFFNRRASTNPLEYKDIIVDLAKQHREQLFQYVISTLANYDCALETYQDILIELAVNDLIDHITLLSEVMRFETTTILSGNATSWVDLLCKYIYRKARESLKMSNEMTSKYLQAEFVIRNLFDMPARKRFKWEAKYIV